MAAGTEHYDTGGHMGDQVHKDDSNEEMIPFDNDKTVIRADQELRGWKGGE